MVNIDGDLYHIHRNGNEDYLWYVGSYMKIDNSFESGFYKKLLEDEMLLTEKYGDYDIDYIISMMEEMKFNSLVSNDRYDEFDRVLFRYYFLRREKALEEGRKIFAPNVPSRLHSIFLTDDFDLSYWEGLVGYNSFKTFLLNLEGRVFISSDKYFPDYKLMFDIQVENSKEYWKPKIKKFDLHKEYVFQGSLIVAKDIR